MNLLLLCFVYASSVDARDIYIPLVQSSGGFFANVSIPTARISNMEMKVFIGSRSRIYDVSRTVARTERHQFVFYNQTMYQYMYQYQELGASVGRSHGGSFLAIGPNSDLTRLEASVAIIRNTTTGTANLVVRSSWAHFVSKCFDGSVFRVTNREGDNIHGMFRLGDVERIDSVHVAFSESQKNLFTAPESFIRTIQERIIAHGGIAVDGSVFANCTRSIVDQLPEIEIALSLREYSFGSFVFHPEDYVDTANDGRCVLKIEATTPGLNFFFINPLGIPNTNVRISSNHIWEFCDAVEP